MQKKTSVQFKWWTGIDGRVGLLGGGKKEFGEKKRKQLKDETTVKTSG